MSEETLIYTNQRLPELLKLIKKNHKHADLKLIKSAYFFAEEAHRGAVRKSGEPYIAHPMAAALTLAEMGLDATTIAAGLLHDVPEDTHKTLQDIEQQFGSEIASLVEGVTKVGKLKYRGIERYMENLCRMFVAMAKDIRVILIRFADRVHNLETLNALPPEKRHRIALESLEIYAQIANRLGMGQMKGKLEDLAFPYVYPKEYQWLIKKVVPEFVEKREFIDRFLAYLNDAMKKHGVKIISIDGRTKYLYSLYKKLLHNNRDLNKIYDLIAIRIIVDNVAQCYEALGVVHEVCKPLKGRIKDYIAQPKPNGYQSLHTTVFSPPQFAKDEIYGQIVEIQIRTQQMHIAAEYGIAAHWRYKGTRLADILHDSKLHWTQNLANLQEQIKGGQILLDTLKIDFLQNYIFVFTPRGDVIELPEDATPIDFAYEIHSDLGNQCTGAKINDQIANLTTTLKNGDVVEIFSTPSRKGPNPDWLSVVKTQHARDHIRSALNKKRNTFLQNNTTD